MVLWSPVVDAVVVAQAVGDYQERSMELGTGDLRSIRDGIPGPCWVEREVRQGDRADCEGRYDDSSLGPV